jgi:hypothetical protein
MRHILSVTRKNAYLRFSISSVNLFTTSMPETDNILEDIIQSANGYDEEVRETVAVDTRKLGRGGLPDTIPKVNISPNLFTNAKKVLNRRARSLFFL